MYIMKKGGIILLLIFILIGIINFLNKSDLLPINESKNRYQSTQQHTPQIIYNYSPKINNGVLIQHKFHNLSYNEGTEQAEWVAYKLNTRFISGYTKRTNRYPPDKDVPTKSAHSNDYKYSGYDRGHLLPAADRKLSKQAMKETFLMSNISPQHPKLNREAWRILEEKVRKATYKHDSLFIVTGPIFTSNKKTIGKNNVTIPSAFYKIILDYTHTSNLCATGFILPNKAVKQPKKQHIATIDSIENITSINFFSQIPDSIQKQFESQNCLELL